MKTGVFGTDFETDMMEGEGVENGLDLPGDTRFGGLIREEDDVLSLELVCNRSNFLMTFATDVEYSGMRFMQFVVAVGGFPVHSKYYGSDNIIGKPQKKRARFVWS